MDHLSPHVSDLDVDFVILFLEPFVGRMNKENLHTKIKLETKDWEKKQWICLMHIYKSFCGGLFFYINCAVSFHYC